MTVVKQKTHGGLNALLGNEQVRRTQLEGKVLFAAVDLVASMRNLAETVNSGRLVEPDRRTDLISELNRASKNFELDVIRVLDPDGKELSPPAGVGTMLSAPSIFHATASIVEPGSRLLATVDGHYVHWRTFDKRGTNLISSSGISAAQGVHSSCSELHHFAFLDHHDFIDFAALKIT